MVSAGRLHTVPELHPISLIPVPGVGLKVDMHPGDTAGPALFQAFSLPTHGWVWLPLVAQAEAGTPKAKGTGQGPSTVWTWGECQVFLGSGP